MQITLRDEIVEVFAERALHWPAAHTLVIADVHFGKDGMFRCAGIPVPKGGSEEMLQRLDRLLTITAADRLLVLGDLWHAASGLDQTLNDTIRTWRERHQQLTWMLVPGNHDRGIERYASDWRLTVTEAQLAEPPFCWCHDPPSLLDRETVSNYAIGGHWHPGLRLSAPGFPTERLPCFWWSKTFGLLPAFNRFTGLCEIRTEPPHRVDVIAGDEVIGFDRASLQAAAAGRRG